MPLRARSASSTRPDRRRLVWYALAAIAGGLMAFAAFPAAGLWPAAVVALGVLYAVLERVTALAAYALTSLFALTAFVPLFTWAEASAGLVPWLGLSIVCALITGSAGLAWSWTSRLGVLSGRHLARAASFATIWTAMEELRERWPFNGFNWGRIAFSQANGPMARYAWLGGATLITWAVAFGGAGLVVAVTALARGQVRLMAIWAGLVAAVILAPAAIPLDLAAQSGSLRVGAVQGNVTVTSDSLFAQRREILHNHAAGTQRLLDQVAPGWLDVVLWPENATDIDPQVDADAAAEIDQAAAAVDAPILVGALEYPPSGGRYNLTLLWQGGVGPIDRYAKQHPAPFAEYIPARGLVRHFSDKVDLVETDMIPGLEVGTIDLPSPRLGRTVILGDVICFEVAYEDIVAASIRAGAEILIVQTNNASFHYSDESVQQLAMSRLRAIEFGRATVQISTVGVSAIIMPDGAIIDSGGLFTAENFVATLPLRTSRTPASWIAVGLSWAVLAIGALAGGAGLIGTIRRRIDSRDRH